MSLVNIVIPVYNGEKYLRETIDSILSQTFTDFEAFLIDDGSTDCSIEIINDYSKKDNRIKLFKKSHEGAVPFAWNYIFKYLSGAWTFYMSHDDLLSPQLLQSLVDKQQESGADAVIPTCHFFSESIDVDTYPDKNKKNDMSTRSESGCISGHTAFELMLDYTIPGFALWRTSLIKKLGMPTESYNSDEGMQRLWARGCDKVAFVPSKFYYRLSSGSITKGLKSYHFNSLLTNLRLLLAAKDAGISEEKIRRFQYHCLGSLLYLKAQSKNSKLFLTDSERSDIYEIFKSVYPTFSNNVRFPRTLRELNLFLCSKSIWFLNLMSSIFVKRLSR